jgi:hypothetical protein
VEVQAGPEAIIRVLKSRLRIRVNLQGREKSGNVDPENVLPPDESDEV